MIRVRDDATGETVWIDPKAVHTLRYTPSAVSRISTCSLNNRVEALLVLNENTYTGTLAVRLFVELNAIAKREDEEALKVAQMFADMHRNGVTP